MHRISPAALPCADEDDSRQHAFSISRGVFGNPRIPMLDSLFSIDSGTSVAMIEV